MRSRGRRQWTMLWRVVCSVVLGVSLGGVARTEEAGASVKQEVEDIFRTVERYMSANTKPVEKPDSKSAEARLKEKMHIDHEDSAEHDDVDKLPVSPRTPSSYVEAGLRPVTFPVGIIMSDHLYPLVVGKNVDSGTPFVMNLNKEPSLVVARASGGSDYKLLIPFPLTVESHLGPENGDVVPGLEYRNLPAPKARYLRYHPVMHPAMNPPRGSYLVNGPSKLRSYDLSEEVPTRPRENPQNHQSYRQYSGEEREAGGHHAGKHPLHAGKKYLKSKPYKNANPRPNPSYLERPKTAIRGYNRVYPKQGISYAAASGANPNLPRKDTPLAYRQPQTRPYQHINKNYNRYPSPAPRYPYTPSYHAPPPPAPKPASYPPVNYAGAYASVPKDFKPSPYLGNITEDTEPYNSGREPRPQDDHYESYDERPYQFTEQDYLDSLNSPGAHSSSGGVHHVTHQMDDYLGKIYEEMYYRMPPPPSDNDRQGTQEYPSANYGVKLTTFNGSNKTENPRPKTLNVSYQEVKQKSTGTNKTNIKNR